MKFGKRFSGNAGATDSKTFLRIKDGEHIDGVVRGEMKEFWKHWSGDTTTVCSGRATCELCEQKVKSSFAFRVNMIVNENGAAVAKILEQGKTVYEGIQAVEDAGYNLDRTKIRISRKGSGPQNTKYFVTTLPTSNLTDEALKNIEAVKLNDINAKGTEEPPHPAEAEDDDGPLPF